MSALEIVRVFSTGTVVCEAAVRQFLLRRGTDEDHG